MTIFMFALIRESFVFLFTTIQTIVGSPIVQVKPGPHTAKLYTCNGLLQGGCDASKWQAICCHRKFNMLNVFDSILK